MFERLDYVSVNGSAIASMAKAKSHITLIESNCASLRSMDAFIVSIFIRRKPELLEKPNSASTACPYGKSALSLMRVSVPHLPGPKPSH